MTTIAIVNLSGNTGKTTLAKHLFAPLLDNARRVSIEDVNTGDGEPDLQIAATKFQALAAELNVADDDENFVIDIGASNAKAMMEHFAQLKTTRTAIDFWVIPVVAAAKQKVDSLNTVKTLSGIGIPTSKVVMVLNNVSDIDSVEHDFAPILAARKLGVHVCGEAVLASEVFEMLKGEAESVFDLVNSAPDFKALKKAARESSDASGALTKLGHRMVLQDLAESAAENLRAVFDALPFSKAGKSALKAAKAAA